jgi:hypothetical protein
MLKYIGGGFIPGVPARDLTEEEAKLYGGRLALMRSGLYVQSGPSRLVRPQKAMPGGDNKAIIPERENK